MNEGIGGGDGPRAAVLRWWSAWQAKDLDAILAMALPEYIEFTGHSVEHRTGRDTLATVARRAFDTFTIHSWELRWQAVHRFGDCALAAYTWDSEVVRSSGAVALRGVATDILVLRDDVWRYAAHHSSPLPTSER